MHAKEITEAMLKGKYSDKLFALVQRHIEDSCDRVGGTGPVQTIVNMVIGTRE